MLVECPHCGNRFNALMGERIPCAQCGREVHVGAGIASPRPDVARPERSDVSAPMQEAGRGPASSGSRGRAIAGLVFNALIPGIGTIVMGRSGEGGMQLLLLLLGILTIPWLVGLAVIAGVWVWAVLASLLEVVASPASSRRPFPQG